ncbi:MAG: hypothetical protein PSY12_01800, partial [bacterium]|nr:hypothetical protein [bacterium]
MPDSILDTPPAFPCAGGVFVSAIRADLHITLRNMSIIIARMSFVVPFVGSILRFVAGGVVGRTGWLPVEASERRGRSGRKRNGRTGYGANPETPARSHPDNRRPRSGEPAQQFEETIAMFAHAKIIVALSSIALLGSAGVAS